VLLSLLSTSATWLLAVTLSLGFLEARETESESEGVKKTNKQTNKGQKATRVLPDKSSEKNQIILAQK